MSSEFVTPRGRVLFVHVPKTGGTWIEAVLRHLGLLESPDWNARAGRGVGRHAPAWQYRGPYEFRFAFVRHPVSWYESWYRMQRGQWRTFERAAWHPQRCIEACASDGFATFVGRVLQRQPAYVTRMYEWLLGPPGTAAVDFVGRYERLQADLIRALDTVGVDARAAVERVEPAGVSPRHPIDWPADLLARVRRAERPAIERFYGTLPRRADRPRRPPRIR